jgi:hypothetical protein
VSDSDEKERGKGIKKREREMGEEERKKISAARKVEMSE